MAIKVLLGLCISLCVVRTSVGTSYPQLGQPAPPNNGPSAYPNFYPQPAQAPAAATPATPAAPAAQAAPNTAAVPLLPGAPPVQSPAANPNYYSPPAPPIRVTCEKTRNIGFAWPDYPRLNNNQAAWNPKYGNSVKICADSRYGEPFYRLETYLTYYSYAYGEEPNNDPSVTVDKRGKIVTLTKSRYYSIRGTEFKYDKPPRPTPNISGFNLSVPGYGFIPPYNIHFPSLSAPFQPPFSAHVSNPSGSGGWANQNPAYQNYNPAAGQAVAYQSYGTAPVQAPGYGTPQSPWYGTAPVQAPAYGTAPVQAPAYGTPPVQAPGYGAPLGQAPGYGAPPAQSSGSGTPPGQASTAPHGAQQQVVPPSQANGAPATGSGAPPPAVQAGQTAPPPPATRPQGS